MQKTFDGVMTLIYLLAASFLAIMALMIMGWSVFEVFDHILMGEFEHEKFISIMLHSVGAIIISVAILDVAKYMFEEEVFRSKELRSIKEARETITKIMVIISIAVSIEGLVYIFKAGTEDVSLLLYPAALILVAILSIVGLGVYQKLSISFEKSE